MMAMVLLLSSTIGAIDLMADCATQEFETQRLKMVKRQIVARGVFDVVGVGSQTEVERPVDQSRDRKSPSVSAQSRRSAHGGAALAPELT